MMNNKILKFLAFIFILHTTHLAYATHDNPSDLHEILGDDWRFQNIVVDESLKNVIESLKNFDIKYNIINPAYQKRLYIYHVPLNNLEKQVQILNYHERDPADYEVKTLANDILTPTRPMVKEENFYLTSDTTLEELLGPHYKNNNIFVSIKLPNLIEKLNNEKIKYHKIETQSPLIYNSLNKNGNKKFILLLEQSEYNKTSMLFKGRFGTYLEFDDDFIFKKIIPESISPYQIASKAMSLTDFLKSDLNNKEIFLDVWSFASKQHMTKSLIEKLGDKIKTADGSIKTVSNLESFPLVSNKEYVFLFKKGQCNSYIKYVENYFEKNKKDIKNNFTIININDSEEFTLTLVEEDIYNLFTDNLDVLLGDNWRDNNIFIDLKFRNLIEKIETNNKNTSPPFVSELKNRDPLKKTVIVLNKNNSKDLQSIRKFFSDNISTIKQEFIIKYLLNDIKQPASLIIENSHFTPSTPLDQILGKDWKDAQIFYSFAGQEMLKESVKTKLGFIKALPMPQNLIKFNTIFNSSNKVIILVGENDRKLLDDITTYFYHNKNYIKSTIFIKKLVGREDVVEHKYISTNNIEDVLEHVVDDTYVFFDYDQTLFLPEFVNVNGLVNKTVDSKIIDVVEKIKQKGGQVLVLTNRGNGTTTNVSSIIKNKDTQRYERNPLSMSNATKMTIELRDAKINLSKLPYDLQNNKKFQDSEREIKIGEKPYIVKRGYFNSILFTDASALGEKAKATDYLIELRTNTNILKPFKVTASDRAKGLTTHYGKAITALEFLRAANLHPRRIIFIDDGQELTTAFHKVMEEFGYDSVVIEYNKAFSEEVYDNITLPRIYSIKRIENIIKDIKNDSANNFDKKINIANAIKLLKDAIKNKEIEIEQAIDGILDLDLSAEDQKKCLISIIDENIPLSSQEGILDEIMSSGVAKEILEKYFKKL